MIRDSPGTLLNIPYKTITLYVNGTKTPTGQISKIPDEFYENPSASPKDLVLKSGYELFPTIASKGSAVECNLSRYCHHCQINSDCHTAACML